MAEILLGRLVGPAGFERPLVVKRILPHLARETAFVRMFLDEARIAARIRHPNVVQVHELLHEEDTLCIVMEYLEGESVWALMRRLTRREARLDYGLCAHIVVQAAAGLHAAHELEDNEGHELCLVHRDVSPQNIFVGYDGAVKVLDFGIAVVRDRTSRTATGQLRGKYEYMSPEQCASQHLDRRSDIFSLGTVLYELSTGRRLFKRSNELLVLKAITEEQPPAPSSLDPSYPPELERIVLRALAKEPADRYADAASMRRELLAVVARLCSEPPDEALSLRMRELFEDRQREKQDMLQRLRAGRALNELPLAEADADVELPAAADDNSQRLALSGKTFVRRAWLSAAIAAAMLAGVGGWALRSRSAPSAGDSQAADPQPAAAEPANERVTIRIQSVPEGASVKVAGSPRGNTPLELELPKSHLPIEVNLELEGFRELTEDLVPNVDQRLRLVLVQKPPDRPAVKAPAHAAPEPQPVKRYRRFN
jgi:serine/threonine-protein kinase